MKIANLSSNIVESDGWASFTCPSGSDTVIAQNLSHLKELGLNGDIKKIRIHSCTRFELLLYSGDATIEVAHCKSFTGNGFRCSELEIVNCDAVTGKSIEAKSLILRSCKNIKAVTQSPLVETVTIYNMELDDGMMSAEGFQKIGGNKYTRM